MKTADLTHREMEQPKAILKKMRNVIPADLTKWWERQAGLFGTYNVLEAQIRVEAHQEHALFLPGNESSLILSEAGEREQQALLELDGELQA
jgi:hypothetical protein